MDYFEPYRQLAKTKGYAYEDSCVTDHFWLLPGDPMLNQKFCLLKKGELFFWAYDMYATKFGMHQTFSGIYRFATLPEAAFTCNVSRHFWFDGLVGDRRSKTGNAYIDKHVTVVTNNAVVARQLITEELIAVYLKLPEEVLPLDLIVGCDYQPAFQGYEGRQIVGVESNAWLTAEQLEQYLPTLEDFICSIRT